jgi:hypothetical protein
MRPIHHIQVEGSGMPLASLVILIRWAALGQMFVATLIGPFLCCVAAGLGRKSGDRPHPNHSAKTAIKSAQYSYRKDDPQ